MWVSFQGSLPVPLAGIIIGRDVLLVGGALVDRARKVRAQSAQQICLPSNLFRTCLFHYCINSMASLLLN